MIDSEKSRAVRVYLGKGVSPFPKRDERAVLEHFGEERGYDLLQYVKGLLDEASQFDWGGGLVEITNRYMAGVRKSHPELDEDAVKALGDMFSYSAR